MNAKISKRVEENRGMNLPDTSSAAELTFNQNKESSVSSEAESALILDIDGYEGPLDVLLTLARSQKIDLNKISILELAEQYLIFISKARQLKLELAADYLVMAAWLAYMKSRILLPETESEEEESGKDMAEALAFRLRRLEAMRDSVGKLMKNFRLGVDVFGFGTPIGIQIIRSSDYQATLYDLLKSFSDHKLSIERGEALQIQPMESFSLESAYKRLSIMIPNIPDWESMIYFLPKELGKKGNYRSAIATTFAASLELAREGKVELRQFEAFGRLYMRNRSEAN